MIRTIKPGQVELSDAEAMDRCGKSITDGKICVRKIDHAWTVITKTGSVAFLRHDQAIRYISGLLANSRKMSNPCPRNTQENQ